MTYNGIHLRQMTSHETKRTSWLLLHPRAEGRQIPQTATCYRCGKRKPTSELKEVGNDVYRCKDGCNVRTQKEGQLRKAMAEVERLSKL